VVINILKVGICFRNKHFLIILNLIRLLTDILLLNWKNIA